MKTITWGVAKHQWLFTYLCHLFTHYINWYFIALSHRYKSIISVSWGGSRCDCFMQWCIVGILLLQRFCSVSYGMKAKSPSHFPPARRWGNYCCPHCCERLLTVKLFRYGANWATFPQRRFWCWKTVEIPHPCFIGISSCYYYYQRHHAFFFFKGSPTYSVS